MKFTKNQFFWLITAIFVSLWVLFSFTWNMKFPNDFASSYDSHRFGAVHVIFNVIFMLGSIALYITLLINLFDDDLDMLDNIIISRGRSRYQDKSDTDKVSLKINWKRLFKWGITLGIVVLLFIGGKNTYKGMITLYNTSVDYNYAYDQKVQEKVGYYDNMWKSYLQIDKNTNINKDVFIEVTKLIMDARKDGENIAWKWLQENQQIPYNEFTKFYSQLNSFIISKRDGYYNIEKDCQEIAYNNNKMLDIFPNNFYNKVLKCKYINFEYGFTSDRTDEVFKSKKENSIIE